MIAEAPARVDRCRYCHKPMRRPTLKEFIDRAEPWLHVDSGNYIEMLPVKHAATAEYHEKQA